MYSEQVVSTAQADQFPRPEPPAWFGTRLLGRSSRRYRVVHPQATGAGDDRAVYLKVTHRAHVAPNSHCGPTSMASGKWCRRTNDDAASVAGGCVRQRFFRLGRTKPVNL